MQEDVKTDKPKQGQESEIDLGVFFNSLRHAILSFGKTLKNLLAVLLSSILELLLFIKRNLVWLLISALIGFGYGFYSYVKNGPSYHADMTVATNSDGSRLLYQKIDYFNALIKEGQLNELCEVFKIIPSQASKLLYFEIAPVDEPLQEAKMYRENFLTTSRKADAVDTLWPNIIKYKDFVKSLTKYDYPQHAIRLYSRSSNIFPKIQQGMINMISNNISLKKAVSANIEITEKEEAILNTSLSGIDSLRRAYNRRIMNEANTGLENGDILIAQSTQKSPEIDLYDKELMLKDELIKLKRKQFEQNNIVRVVSDFNSVGTRVSKSNEEFVQLAWIAVLTMSSILILLQLFKYLTSLEKKKEVIEKP
jgi:hypothetical protein